MFLISVVCINPLVCITVIEWCSFVCLWIREAGGVVAVVVVVVAVVVVVVVMVSLEEGVFFCLLHCFGLHFVLFSFSFLLLFAVVVVVFVLHQ